MQNHMLRMPIKLGGWFLLALGVGCIEDSPQRDGVPDAQCLAQQCQPNTPDMGQTSSGQWDMQSAVPDTHPTEDAGQHDQTVPELENDQGLPPAAACLPIQSEEPIPSLAGANRIQQVAAGTPLADGQWWLGNLDGDPGEQGEFVIVRGGRVEALI
jgi:hypothetical protein